MSEMAMRREGNALVPVDPVSAEDLALLQSDRELLVTARSPRNIRQHRLAWALAQKLSDATDFLPDRETAMDYLKLKARHAKLIVDGSGVVTLVPKSISFASLDQQGFARLLNRMIYVICSEIVPGLEESKLRAEIESMVAPAPHKPNRRSSQGQAPASTGTGKPAATQEPPSALVAGTHRKELVA